MSGGSEALQITEDDVSKLLAASAHLGTNNLDFQMETYVYKRRADGVFLLNLRKTWEKVVLAARAIVAIENPADVYVISSRQYGQRAVLKFASATGATPIAGRFTPGTFTNQSRTESFREPRLLVVCDPRADHQPITEASYVNIPVIAFCNTDSPLRYVDVAIPCNNKGIHSIGLMWWMLAREVLRLKGTIPRKSPWEVMVDMYFYREAEEQEKEQEVGLSAEKTVKIESDFNEPVEAVTTEFDAAGPDSDWNAQVADEWTAPTMSAGTTTVAAGAVVDDWTSAAPTQWTAPQ